MPRKHKLNAFKFFAYASSRKWMIESGMWPRSMVGSLSLELMWHLYSLKSSVLLNLTLNLWQLMPSTNNAIFNSINTSENVKKLDLLIAYVAQYAPRCLLKC